MWKLCRSLFEQRDWAVIIDSVKHMKTRAATSLAASGGEEEIRDVDISAFSYERERAEWHQRQELEHQNTTQSWKSFQAMWKCKHETGE